MRSDQQAHFEPDGVLSAIGRKNGRLCRLQRRAYETILLVYVRRCSQRYLAQALDDLGYRADALFGNIVNVSCLGGGPGSDIIGVLKFFEEHRTKPIEKIRFHSFDKEENWKEIRNELLKFVQTKFAIKFKRHPWDIRSEWSSEARTALKKTDLFTLSYFVSEVYSLETEAKAGDYWGELFQLAKPGAIFVYVDNSFDSLNAYFDKCCEEAGLERKTNFEGDLRTRRREDSKVVNEYKEKFKYSPKLKATGSYRVLMKPE